MKTAICPGSFDPITMGHLDVILRASRMYDRVVVGVADNIGKKTLFPLEERASMVADALPAADNIEVKVFDSLLVDFASENDASVIVRGLRAVSDFEHEFQMAQLNRKLNPDIETVFVMASPEYAYLSSSAVREIARYGGCVEGLVPPNVEERLRQLFRGKEV